MTAQAHLIHCSEETWPAVLQQLTGRRVLNGGMTGYGFDQIVLRAEQLVAVHRPSTVIVGFIANDIWRTEMCRLWWHDKPWFGNDQDRHPASPRGCDGSCSRSRTLFICWLSKTDTS